MSRWVVLAEASPRHGFGHAARSNLLAAAAAEAGIGVTIVVPEGTPLQSVPSVFGIRVVQSAWRDEAAVADLIGRAGDPPDVIVIDAPDEVTDALAWTAGAGRLVIAFRMHGLDQLAGVFEDISLTPSFEQPSEVRRTLAGRAHRHLAGRDLIMVRPSCFAAPAAPKETPARVLVTMGGADPGGLTMLACRACEGLRERPHVTIAVGALNPAWPELVQRFGATFDLVRQGEVDFDALLVRSSVAVINGGLTRYECIAAQTPFVAISLNDAQRLLSEQVVGTGFGLHAGVLQEATAERVAAAVQRLLDEPSLLQAMRRAGADAVRRDAPSRLVARIEAWSRAAVTLP